MPRTFFVLGAGIYQLPLILRLKSRGDRVVVASAPGKYPGIDLADTFYPVDTRDSDALTDIARRERIDAVLTAGTDVALVSLGRICDSLNLPGPTERMALLATNKRAMKQAFAESGVRTARFSIAHNHDQAMHALEQIGLPSMVKCVDMSGSRGISKVERLDDVSKALERALDVSSCDYVVIEQFVSGHEVGVDGYVDRKGRIAFYSPHDKVVWNNGLTDIPVGHRINEPFLAHCAEHTDLRQQTEKAIRSLGMRDCFFNMDVLLADNEAWIIEAGVRTGATCIPEVIGSYYGIDYYEQLIAASSGEQPRFEKRAAVDAVEARLLFSPTESVYVREPALAESGISLSIDYPTGSSLPAFRAGNDRVGQIIACGASPRELQEKIERIERHVQQHCFTPQNERPL